MARPLGPVIRIDPPSRGHRRRPSTGSGLRRRRSSTRHRMSAARWRLIVLALVCACGFGAATLFVPADNDAVDVGSQPSSAMGPGDAAVARVGVPAAAKRVQYRYSVIPRGVFSAEELEGAIGADPVVAAHYQSFDAAGARLVHLERPRLAYVSYRLGDRVFWTRKPVHLPAGESLLSDGTNVVRTRCGNRVSDVPGETSPDEPDPILIDTPIEDPVELVGADPDISGLLLLVPPMGVGAVSVPAALDPSQHSVPAPPTDPIPTTTPLAAPVVIAGGRQAEPRDPEIRIRPEVPSVPEPTVVALMAAGLLGVWRQRRRAK